jgi:PKD repeat protein
MFIKDNISGSSAATTDVIVLDLGPSAGFSWSPDPQVEGSSVSFSDGSSSSPDVIVSWSWSFGDGDFSSVQNPIHVFVDDDVFTV